MLHLFYLFVLHVVRRCAHNRLHLFVRRSGGALLRQQHVQVIISVIDWFSSAGELNSFERDAVCDGLGNAIDRVAATADPIAH